MNLNLADFADLTCKHVPQTPSLIPKMLRLQAGHQAHYVHPNAGRSLPYPLSHFPGLGLLPNTPHLEMF